jgi:hypothetical protein
MPTPAVVLPALFPEYLFAPKRNKEKNDDEHRKGQDPPQENNPESGSVSLFFVRVATGKPRYSLLFVSCGEYGKSSSRLPKYGRFPSLQMALNGLSTALVFATYSGPSDPKKGCRNANMSPVFYDGDP